MNKHIRWLQPIWLTVLLVILTPAQTEAQSTVSCAQSVTVQSGDTLSGLARTHLGNLAAYPEIVEATNAAAVVDNRYATIRDPGTIGVGWLLCIPSVTSSVNQASLPATTGDTHTESWLLQPYATPEEHPYSIAWLRSQEFPGSEITIEQTLAPGSNYRRYIASYESDGFEIDALLTVPVGEKPLSGWPVIIFNHGYITPSVYRTGQRYVAYVDTIARNGYIVLAPDYRGHGFSEGEPASGHGSPAYTIDVLNAIASIEQFEEADPERIGLWGHSMGGAITLRAMLVDERIDAGVIWGGVVVSFLDSFEHTDLQGVRVPTWFEEPRQDYVEAYGSLEENPDFWQATSPNAFLAELSGPIQLHHATADESVPVEYSDVLQEQIESAGGVVEYYRYEGDNHNISVNFATAMARTVAFFDRYVKGR